jgi:hypothetical protein
MDRIKQPLMGRAQVIFGLYLLLSALHVMITWQQQVPIVIPDEVSYIAQARFFAGLDDYPDVHHVLQHEKIVDNFAGIPETKGWKYYHFGYSLFIAPVYALVNDIDLAYKSVLVLNSFLLSSLFLILYAWLRVIASIEPHTASLIALVTALYPAYMLHSHVAWAENLFIVGVALSCLLFAWHLKTGRLVMLVAFSLVAALQYAVHPRGLAIVMAASMVLLLLLVFRRDRIAQHVVALLLLIVAFAAIHLMVQEMASLMSNPQQADYVQKKMGLVLDLNILPVFAGNLYYLILASLGLFLVGLLFCLMTLFEALRIGLARIFDDVRAGSILYLFLLSGITFSVSVFYFSLPFKLGDEAIANAVLYGRYNEVFLGFYIALGLLWLSQRFDASDRIQVRGLNITYGVVVVLAIPLSLYVSGSAGLRMLHTYGLYPWSALLVGFDGWWRMAPVFIIPLLWGWLILQTFQDNKIRATSLVGLYFFVMDLWLFVYITPDLQM